MNMIILLTVITIRMVDNKALLWDSQQIHVWGKLTIASQERLDQNIL